MDTKKILMGAGLGAGIGVLKGYQDSIQFAGMSGQTFQDAATRNIVVFGLFGAGLAAVLS